MSSEIADNLLTSYHRIVVQLIRLCAQIGFNPCLQVVIIVKQLEQLLRVFRYVIDIDSDPNQQRSHILR